jgi:hypothetical protein
MMIMIPFRLTTIKSIITNEAKFNQVMVLVVGGRLTD